MKKVLLICILMVLSIPILVSINSNTVYANDEIDEDSSFDESNYTSILNEWKSEGLRDDFDFFKVISPLQFSFNSGKLIEDSSGYYNFLQDSNLEVNEASKIYDFSDSEEMSFDVTVDNKGLYSLELDYYSFNTTIRDTEIAVYVNDRILYFELSQLRLTSNWEVTEDISTDRYKNDIMPNSSIKSMWIHEEIRDSQRIQPESLLFKLDEGLNKITIKKARGEFYLGQIYVSGKKALKTYNEYLQEKNKEKIVEKSIQTYEAEDPVFKNSLQVRYGTDKSANVTPFALMENKLNIIDGASFKQSGNSLSYEMEVSESGMYHLTLKVKQTKSSSRVFRTLYVNGKIPFLEAKEIAFDHSSKWQNVTVGKDKNNPYLLYLEKGINIITLEVNASPLLSIYETVDYVMEKINDLGLDIKKLTGNNIDENRDWDLEKNIPNIREDLQSYTDLLYGVHNDLININGTDKSSEILINIKRSADTLQEFANNPNYIPKDLNKFSIGSNSVLQKLGLILPLILEQPLSVDKLYLHGNVVDLPKANANFFKNIWIGIKRFFLSFFSDEYSDKAEEGELEVWVNRSRQYVNLMQQMVDKDFTKETGINVKISIMPNEDKLILAASSNSQPDVALGVAGWRPYDFAIRNALVDLRTMPNFFEVTNRFKEGAFAQLIYQDGVYGLPETQNFYLLFYRKDILQNIKVEVPDTWQDVIDLLPEIQRYGMNFYSQLSSTTAFKAYITTMPFINQFGGNLYSNDLLKSELTDPKTIAALDFMAELFTIYSLPLEVGSFYNSFRYGTLPLGIGDFSMYVQLLHAAPEIAGLWDVAPLPGVKNDEGEIDRSYDGAATSGIIFKNSDMQDEAWQFLEWWTREDVQLDYSENLITSMGPEYMWNTSNVEAFKQMSWDENHKLVFLEQWEWIFDTPKTPASYMMEREISNIWNKIVYDGINTRIAISDSAVIIDKEITKKMIEFKYITNKNEVIKTYRFPTRETISEWVRE
ncbi:MAG: extracellular solute-binding protein [Acholeplasma sp.]|nr:extracellular solute-binding protein [Acholeplasma sp.]